MRRPIRCTPLAPPDSERYRALLHPTPTCRMRSSLAPSAALRRAPRLPCRRRPPPPPPPPPLCALSPLSSDVCRAALSHAANASMCMGHDQHDAPPPPPRAHPRRAATNTACRRTLARPSPAEYPLPRGHLGTRLDWGFLARQCAGARLHWYWTSAASALYKYYRFCAGAVTVLYRATLALYWSCAPPSGCVILAQHH